jgi:uncharacterized protein (TIGR04255 family)
MKKHLPVSLGQSPLLESIFEIRFETSIPSAGDILPGILFLKLKDLYPNIEALPISNVPRSIRDQDPALIFQPSHRLAGNNMIVQIGDRVLSISAQDYPGWEAFKSAIIQLLEVASETGFIDKLSRYSFRYVNLLPKIEGKPEMSLLNLDIAVSGTPPFERGLQMRFEQDDNDYTTIIQIALQTSLQQPDMNSFFGVLVDVDTVMPNPSPDFLSSISRHLDPCHATLKTAFFSIVSDLALQNMYPVYQ